MRRVIIVNSVLFVYYYCMGMWIYYKYKNYEKAMKCFQKALNNNPNHAKCNFKLGMCYFKKKMWSEAKKFIENAVTLNGAMTSWRVQLSQSKRHLNNVFFQPQKLWWKEVEDIQKTIDKKGGSFLLYKELAIALENMKRYQEAAKNYQLAIDNSNTEDSQIYYRMGFCYETRGNDGEPNLELSQKAYAKAIEFDKSLNSDKLGIGIFHENRQYWVDANRAYLQDSFKNDNIENDDLFYHLAASYERIYQWKGAEEAYKKTLAINYHRPYTHYRLGVVLEKQNDFEQACVFYREAIRRDANCPVKYFYRLANCLMVLKCYEEASKIFVQINRIDNNAFNQNLNFPKDSFSRDKTIYLDFYENEQVLENTILYQAHTAEFMSCNPYAIFLHLLNDRRFDDFTHIWVLNDLKYIPLEFRRNKKIIFVKCFSKLYFRYLASAKYLINSGSFCRFFVRKPEQKYLATWHGTPWKCLGKDIKRSFMSFEITQKDFLQSTHIISPNKHTTKILIQKHDIEKIFQGKVYESGYPRIDITLKLDNLRKQKIRERLEIDMHKKIVLYAPTYRSSFDNAELNIEKLIQDLEIFKESGFNVIFRGHYILERKLVDSGIPSVPRDIDTNELLSVVDILICDYSSIAFDFMVLNRPIIYYVYDYEDYKYRHGLYFDVEMFNAIYCKTAREVLEILQNPLMLEKCKTSQEIKDVFLSNEDGFATQRVVEFFFFDEYDDAKIYKIADNKINLLIYPGGLGNNGISVSFTSFVNYLDLSTYNVHIAVDSWKVRESSICMKYINQIKDKVFILGNPPNVLSQTREENWLLSNPIFKNKRVNQEQEEIFAKCFARDFRCLYGDSKFDSLISFDGYGELWAYRFAYAKTNAKKIIYLHSDMRGEFEVKFPYLETIFNVYKYFDYIFSVSKELSNLNRDNLANAYQVERDKFDFMNNIIDYKNILFKSGFALENKEDEIIFNDNSRVFINIARLSPEKNQITLIKAFQRINSEFNNVKLIIMGDGPLREDLKIYISENNIKNVYLLGNRNNPYPYLKKADCFVLSSLHEGQPTTLLESLVLKKPIIATNIMGNRSVLNSHGGLLVDPDINGLSNAMMKYLKETIQSCNFDYVGYNNAILGKFNHLFGVYLEPYKDNRHILSPCIIMAKPDGFGMRLFAMMSGLLLSKKTGLPFYFKWVMIEDVIGNLYEMFNSTKHIPFALGKVEEIFSKEFIQRYCINDYKDIASNHGFGLHQIKRTFDDIKNGPFEQKWGWYAPGIGGGALSNWIEGYNEEQCYKDFAEIYKEIGFSEKYRDIIKSAKQIARNLGEFIAIHIRGADIVYSSAYKKASLYGFVGDKYFPYEIAIEIIKNQIKDYQIVIFSQDIQASRILIEYFNNKKIILADQFASQFLDVTERAFFEMNLLSHASLVYTPGISLQKSAFSQCASFFSGVKKDISFHEIFSEEEQFQIIQKNIHELQLNPLYKSMAFFRLYQLSLKLQKGFGISLQFIEKAIFEDSSNTAWIIHWIHLNLCYGHYDIIEEYLAKNLNKIQNDLFGTLSLFRGIIYKGICLDIVKMEKKSEKYPQLSRLIKEIRRIIK